VNVVAGGAEVAGAAGDEDGFVTAAEEMAEVFVFAVEPGGVGAEQPFHAGDKVGLGRFEDEVKMVSHEAPGVDLEFGFEAGFAEGFEEKFTIGIVEEDVFAPVAAAHDVVKSSGKLDTWFAGHGK